MRLRPQRMSTGTATTVPMANVLHTFPTRNRTSGQFEHADKLNGVAVRDGRMVTNKACFACTIACGRIESFRNISDSSPA